MVVSRRLAIGLWPMAAMLSVGASKQDAPEVTSKVAAAVFQSSTNLVQVPVVVRDREGRAAGNLRAEDFQLSDNGKPQLISRFAVEQMQARESMQARSNTSGPRTADTAGGVLPSRFLAYLADDVNLAPEDFVNGRGAALRHIETLAPSDRAAIYSSSGRVTQGFTDDRELLRKTFLGIHSLNRQASWIEPTLRCRPMTFYRADLIVAGDPGGMKDCAGAEVSDPNAEGALIVRQAVVMADAQSVVQRSERDPDGKITVAVARSEMGVRASKWTMRFSRKEVSLGAWVRR